MPQAMKKAEKYPVRDLEKIGDESRKKISPDAREILDSMGVKLKRIDKSDADYRRLEKLAKAARRRPVAIGGGPENGQLTVARWGSPASVADSMRECMKALDAGGEKGDDVLTLAIRAPATLDAVQYMMRWRDLLLELKLAEDADCIASLEKAEAMAANESPLSEEENRAFRKELGLE